MRKKDGEAKFCVIMENSNITKLEIVGNGEVIIKMLIAIMINDEDIKSLFYNAVLNFDDCVEEIKSKLN